jgi:hypothetical protein
LTTSYTATGLTSGLTYRFKVEAKNAFGYSAFSDEVVILCAAVPSTVITPTTTVVADNIIFDWDAPSANGISISGYKVFIRKADLAYILDPSVCNGLDLIVMALT